MDEQKVVCIIQARMGSSRLPGKVLMDICGHPMLEWVTTRVGKAERIDQLVVATTTESSDIPIVDWCAESGIRCFCGEPFDVLDRFYQAAVDVQAEVIVRITADCPLIDPEMIDEVINAFTEHRADFAANRLPLPFERKYPIGLDIEVVSFNALEMAWKNATQPFEREHVMPYFYSEEDRFNVFILDAKENHGHRRWTVDTPQDLEFIRQLTGAMDCGMDFSWRDVLKVLESKPELEKINSDVIHKTYKDVDNRKHGSTGK